MIVGVAVVKDEADIIEPTIRHMATQVDGIIVADNRSTDGTRQILDRLAGELPVTVVDDPEVGYYQSRKTTDMLHLARAAGAEWCVPFDADEIAYSPFGRIADVLPAVVDDGHNDCTGGVCDAYSRAADIYRGLAQASRPDTTALPEQSAVVTIQ